MANRVLSAIAKMPRITCGACHGMGSVRMTAHFHSGDTEFEAPCWECFGSDVKVQFPKPSMKDNT